MREFGIAFHRLFSVLEYFFSAAALYHPFYLRHNYLRSVPFIALIVVCSLLSSIIDA